MRARHDILANIRQSLGVTGQEAPRRMIVSDRLERAPKGYIPARGSVKGDDRLNLFKAMVLASQATISDVLNARDVPVEIARYLRENNLPAQIRMGDDPRLEAMEWAKTSLSLSKGPSDGRDLNAVSYALAGIAETGTLALISGKANPTTLNFLPDTHIIIVSGKDILGSYEDLWTQVRFDCGKGEMPRTVNWVTGPSRSGDIEQTLLLGAHGPRSVHVILVMS